MLRIVNGLISLHISSDQIGYCQNKHICKQWPRKVPDRRYLVADRNRRRHDLASPERLEFDARLRNPNFLQRAAPSCWNQELGKSQDGELCEGDVCIDGAWPGMACTLTATTSNSTRLTSPHRQATTLPAMTANAKRTTTSPSQTVSITTSIR